VFYVINSYAEFVWMFMSSIHAIVGVAVMCVRCTKRYSSVKQSCSQTKTPEGARWNLEWALSRISPLV